MTEIQTWNEKSTRNRKQRNSMDDADRRHLADQINSENQISYGRDRIHHHDTTSTPVQIQSTTSEKITKEDIAKAQASVLETVAKITREYNPGQVELQEQLIIARTEYITSDDPGAINYWDKEVQRIERLLYGKE